MSELLTVSEIAALLNVSEDTVTRRFSGVKGVVDIGSPETPKRRRYRVLRIPKAIVEKYLLTRGGSGRIEGFQPKAVPERKPTKATKPSTTEDELVRDLATLAGQRGVGARRFVEEIAERARLLTFVPQSQWADVVWLSDEGEDI